MAYLSAPGRSNARQWNAGRVQTSRLVSAKVATRDNPAKEMTVGRGGGWARRVIFSWNGCRAYEVIGSEEDCRRACCPLFPASRCLGHEHSSSLAGCVLPLFMQAGDGELPG